MLENIQKMFNFCPKLDAVSEVTMDIDVGVCEKLKFLFEFAMSLEDAQDGRKISVQTIDGV